MWCHFICPEPDSSYHLLVTRTEIDALMTIRSNFILSCLLALLSSGAFAQDTLTVCAQGCDYARIQDAIDAASEGDVIELRAETYTPDSSINPEGKALTLLGVVDEDGLPASVIDGRDTIRPIRCANSETALTIFQNLVVTRGSASGSGGGMYVGPGATPLVRNCLFIANACTGDGGGIVNIASFPTLIDTVFSGNVAGNSGGGICNFNGSNPTITNCLFEGNTANYGGGIVNLYGSAPVLFSCRFLDNIALLRGGGIADRSDSGSMVISCEFTGNEAAIEGGGVYNGSDIIAPTISDSFLCGNTPEEIVGIWNDAGDNCIGSTCLDCDIPCPADADGDGMVDGADLTMFLGAWDTADPLFDYDGNGMVDGADLLVILGAWGDC